MPRFTRWPIGVGLIVLLLALGVRYTAAVPVPSREDRRNGLEVDLGDGVSIKFVHIQAGTFEMGSPNEQQGRGQEPLHEVTITQPFMLGVYEVTQRQFRQLMGTNPSAF